MINFRTIHREFYHVAIFVHHTYVDIARMLLDKVNYY